MKALSLRQPWAWLMVRPDITDPAERVRAYADRRIKDIENREWKSRYTGPLLIHASKGMTKREYADVALFISCRARIPIDIALPPIDALQFGGVIGKTFMSGCVDRCASPWFFGKYGFSFDRTEPVPFMPYKGELGLFNIDY